MLAIGETRLHAGGVLRGTLHAPGHDARHVASRGLGATTRVGTGLALGPFLHLAVDFGELALGRGKVVFRGSDAVGGWLFAGLRSVMELPVIALISVPLSLVWLALAHFLGRAHEARAATLRHDAS